MLWRNRTQKLVAISFYRLAWWLDQSRYLRYYHSSIPLLSLKPSFQSSGNIFGSSSGCEKRSWVTSSIFLVAFSFKICLLFVCVCQDVMLNWLSSHQRLTIVVLHVLYTSNIVIAVSRVRTIVWCSEFTQATISGKIKWNEGSLWSVDVSSLEHHFDSIPLPSSVHSTIIYLNVDVRLVRMVS